MTRAAKTVLRRMEANPSPLYVREIVQGCPKLSTDQVLEALVELHEDGLVVPRTWALAERRGETRV